MPRFNAAFFAMMQKLREKKRREARISWIKSRKRNRRTDALPTHTATHQDADPVRRLSGSKIKLPKELSPVKVIRPDVQRGQGHYQSLEDVKPKALRKRLKPITAKAPKSALEKFKSKCASEVRNLPNAAEIDAMDVWLGNIHPTGRNDLG